MFALLFLFIAVVAAYPARGPCTGDCWTKDPAVIQRSSDGTYFRFGTGTGVVTMTSPSLKGPWKDVGAALPSGSKINVEGVDSHDIWAPDVHKEGDTYYMYYVLSKLGTQTSQIGVATSTTLEPGSWTDHGEIGLPANSAYNRIDPNWIEIGGKQYLQFGSYWQDIYQVELANALQVGSAAPYQLSWNASLNHRQEGSFMYKNGDYYYLFFSAGLAGSYTANSPPAGEEYSVRVCRSATGTGHFVDKAGNDCKQSGGTMVLASHDQVYGPGGEGVINDKDLGPVLVYHYYPLSLKQSGGSKGNDGYQFGWNELDFASGWPVVKAT
ncbi:arabinan endo-1-5-alpha-L-arabinosidase C [Penicillium chermesinum]|uniref:Arabinan endo-1,5-alpha-L-arabinosidase n=1 Tax=Penicillium chermesinum TaxID=63820 RepID=A0A9W9NTM1_9EURO|nr:arabinan endo-1-5-alpha-L-arabinosidase C [Penicillium chermesinum]KAJ5225907.1 arabinan endo-1-5-alpha-L-arabinosidase C [Penicillium chermesinum]KAJ6160886.1 arabinan endo-1-5-alpha-L-arabinosidase C [Penicillium chermesinum]